MNKIINLIKNFIINIKNKFTTNNIEKEKQKIPTQEINDNEIKKNITLTNINWDLIDNLKNYDIVFVKMDEETIKEKELKEKENKQKRPFIIKEKNNDNNTFYGHYFTSNVTNHYFFKKEQYKGLRFIIDHTKYHLNNNSLIRINELFELPYENIIHYMAHLDENDQKKLEKYTSLLNKKTVISNKDNKVIEIGDIILDNNIYYIIYQADNTNCYAYPITLYDRYIDLSINHDYFLFNHKVYFVDYKNYKIFNINDNILITNRFNSDIVDTIKENKKIKKSKQKQKNRRKH